MALVRKSEMVKLSDPEAMNQKGRRIGVEKNTTGEAYARRHLDQYDHRAVRPGRDKALAAVRGGDVDYFIHDAPTGLARGRSRAEGGSELVGIYRPMTDEYLAWAVRKSDFATLGALLDGKVEEWQKDGQLQAVIDRWIPVTKISK